MTDSRYFNLKNIINNKTEYILHGTKHVKNEGGAHHISQCNNLDSFNNVKIIKHNRLCMRKLRDNGTIKQQIDSILHL
jgi:hypothetical protein